MHTADMILDTMVSLREQDDITSLREEIDRLDAEILAHVRRRVEITRRAGKARVGSGMPRDTRHAEMSVLRKFERDLGRDGLSLGMVLLRLGRTGLPVSA